MMRRQQGLSLIELMISITLGLVLMTGVIQMFLTSQATFATQQAISRVQETGRMAMEFLARDIRMAGYMGCSSRNPGGITYGLDDTNHQFDFLGGGIRGYDAATNPLEPNLATAGTDVLAVRRASSEAVYVTGTVSDSSSNIDVTGTVVNGCVGGVCDGDAAVLSDCTQGRIFLATNVSQLSGQNSTQVRVVHSAGGGSGPGNIDTKLGGQSFEPGSELLGLRTTTYYIAPSSFNPNTSSLWQNVNGNASELVEGVEDMRVLYGESTDTDSVPDVYRPATGSGAVVDWERVSAVRVQLLVQSSEDDVLPEPQPYTFPGDTQVTDTAKIGDRRMRQVFTSTVSIRSRLD